MGKMLYGNPDIVIDFDDRALAHLQIVIGSKLRRHESFFLSWRDDESVGNGRSAIWMDSAIPLYFKFSGSKIPAINRDWIRILSDSSNSGQGLIFSAEPGMPAATPRGHV
ncbi:DUF7882 family protein [Agreia sp. Leaf210]|uniref:DUF7882 family protein n=1 Tax=Agreia sp. Leaf210 TaxID=1735682 RepID=UPI0006FD8D1C|nr:hypothetical protein [Agreia sp. Leaf210]KQM57477.1 ATP-dependent DNA ligase [Agreia sp. Leaf210]